MHSKVNPISFRLNRKEIPQAELFKCCWFTTNKKKFKSAVEDDFIIEWSINTFFANSPFSFYRIKRFFPSTLIIEIYSPNIGGLIGQKSVILTKFRELIETVSTFKKIDIYFFQSKRAANFVAQIIAIELRKGIGAWVKQVRNVLKQVKFEQEDNLLGYKVVISGRLNGAEKTKQRIFREGTMPLHTIESNIDYALIPAITNYGSISVKVWLHTKDSLVRFKNKMDEIKMSTYTKKEQYENIEKSEVVKE